MAENLEESTKNHVERRITWREVPKILKICGYHQLDYAKLVELFPCG